MDVRVRCCGLGVEAADRSIITKTSVQNYLESEEYKSSIEGKLTLGYLTHRGRSLDAIPSSGGNPATLKKVVGRDDAGLILAEGMPTFTHYVKEFYIESVPGKGEWLCALVHILDEKDGFDEASIANIKRLKALIRSGISLTCSLVVVAFWDSQNSGIDLCSKIKLIKSLDWTVNPSFGTDARIYEVIDDEVVKEDLTKAFSDIYSDEDFIKSQPKDGEFKVKNFSDISSLGLSDIKKSSKINGKFTTLKVKEFSTLGSITIVEEPVIEEQKNFTQSEIRERLRETKMGNRMLLRRKYMSYKQAIRGLGGIENIKEEDLRILKSLFTSDILNVLSSKEVTEGIINGKQINTMLGLSALSKTARIEGQKLQIPLRMAHLEARRQGFIPKQRYQKLQAAYIDFINGLMSDVFGENPEPIPAEDEAEMNKEENNNK